MTVKPGMRFTHPTRLDTDWRPDVAAGEKYADAPHVECVVTRVTRRGQVQVYYRDADGHGRFTSPLAALEALGVTFR